MVVSYLGLVLEPPHTGVCYVVLIIEIVQPSSVGTQVALMSIVSVSGFVVGLLVC